MSVYDKDGVVVLGNSPTANENITIKTPDVPDGSIEFYQGIPDNLGNLLFSDKTIFGSGSLTTNGFIEIPLKISGVYIKAMIQWGEATVSNGGGGVLVTFNPPFQTACLHLSGNTVLDNSATACDGPLDKSTGSLSAIYSDLGTISNVPNGTTIRWFAIGF